MGGFDTFAGNDVRTGGCNDGGGIVREFEEAERTSVGRGEGGGDMFSEEPDVTGLGQRELLNDW